MTCEFLQNLGLEKNTINKILDQNIIDIDKANANLDNLSKECESFKSQLLERDKQIQVLLSQNHEQQKNYEAELAQLKLDYAIDAALTASGAKNNRAVKSLLDLESVKLDDFGNLSGFDNQLDNVKNSDPYLFDNNQHLSFKGFQPAQSEDGLPLSDTSNMTYSQLTAFLKANPDAKI